MYVFFCLLYNILCLVWLDKVTSLVVFTSKLYFTLMYFSVPTCVSNLHTESLYSEYSSLVLHVMAALKRVDNTFNDVIKEVSMVLR